MIGNGGINSNLAFTMPKLPQGADQATLLLVQPLYDALMQLFIQVSDQVGQTVLDPTLYSTMPITTSLKLNNFRVAYRSNTTGATITAGVFVYITAAGVLALSGTTSATAPVGFTRAAISTGNFGPVVLFEGLLTSSGLTPGAKYQAGASGTLVAFTTGTPIAVALSATVLYVRIPIY